MSKFARVKAAIRGEEVPAATGAESAPAAAADLSAMDRRVKPPLVTMRAAITAAAIVALLVLTGGFYWRYGLTNSLSVDGERITVASAQQAIFQEYIPVTGNTVPAVTVYLDAVEGGQVTDVLVEEGQTVEAGQPLLELKNSDLQLRMVETEAQFAGRVNDLNSMRLQAQQTDLQHQQTLISIGETLGKGERDLRRSEALLETDAVPRREVEDLRSLVDTQRQLQAMTLERQRIDREMQANQVEQQQATVDRMSANLELVRQSLENLVMRAPISGQLTVFDANLGEAKSRGQRIGQIDDIGAFKVTALVDEFYLGRIAIGQPATVQIGREPAVLEVTKVYPDVRERQFQIDLEFTGEPPADLRRGQTLRMNLEIGARDESRVVANGPWVDDTGGTWAFVLTPDGGAAHRRALTIGRRNPDMVEVQSGLEDGERIIVSSYAQMMDFDRIDIRGTPGQ